jgi:hypothetical protein
VIRRAGAGEKEVWAGSRPGQDSGATKEDGVTYQARQADLTGGAANFFLVTPLALALAPGAAADGAARGAESSAMTGFAGSFESIRRRWLSGTGFGWTEIIRSAYARGVKGKQTPVQGRRVGW